MKNSLNFLTKWCLSLMVLIIAAGLWSQNLYSQDKDIRHEVLVYFLPDSLELPAGEVRDVSIDRALIQSEGLSQALQRLPVQALDRAFPELTDADTIRVRQDGVTVKLPQWSRVFIVRLASRQAVEEALETLSDEPGVLFAEPHSDMQPDDHLFAQQWHLNNTGQNFGTPGADINALDAWNIFTGSSSVRLAIVDTGVETNHGDLAGKASGDQPDTHPFHPYGHGTHVAGIAGAAHNQGHVRGVDHGTEILSRAVFSGFETDPEGVDRPDWVGNNTAYNRIVDAVDSGADVLNNSYSGPQFSNIVRSAFAHAYKMNRVSVATMGNLNSSDPRYPGAYGQGLIAVGATNRDDVRWESAINPDVGSNFGNHISVAAPGAVIMSTERNNDHDTRTGTSMAAPIVSGIATLLKGYDSSLYNDDIQRIIELSADEVRPDLYTYNSDGWNVEMGHGRVNAHQALLRLQSPYVVEHHTKSGGSVHSSTGTYTKTFLGVPGLADGTYIVKRYDVRTTVDMPWVDDIYIWGRGVATTGYSSSNPNFGMGFTDVVSTGVSTSELRTYVYEVWTTAGQKVGWVPASPSNVEYAYTMHGIPGTPPPPPPPPPSVSISGPSNMFQGSTDNFTANVSGGSPPYSYQWYYRHENDCCWTNTGVSTQTYTHTAGPPSGEHVRVVVQDQFPHTEEDQHFFTILGWSMVAEDSSLPDEFSLTQNYPNPFNPSSTIRYELPERAEVTLSVYNMLGQRVALLIDGEVQPGRHEAVFEASNLSSGNYIARFQASGISGERFTRTLNMQLVK